MFANICPKCGGTMSHIATDVNGKRYYQCFTGLTSFPIDGSGSKVSSIVSCNNVVDNTGKEFKGGIAYVSEGNTRTMIIK